MPNLIKRKKIKVALEGDPRKWNRIFWGVFILAGFLAIWGLFALVPRQNLDNNYEVWLKIFDDLIRAGRIFPGWAKTYWFEHGAPLFVLYPPLFYYLAEIPRLLGLSLVMAIKSAIILSTLGAFFSMHLLGRELWGRWGGLAAALIYLTAPYHFALIYTRGAFAENLAYAIFPLATFFIYKLFRSPSWKYVVGLAITGAALVLTNLPALLVFGVFALIFVIALAMIYKKIPALQICIAGIGALGLSVFYWLPAIIANPLVQSESLVTGRYDFSQHFASLWGILSPTQWDKNHFFQIGLVSLLIIGLAIYVAIKRRTNDPRNFYLAMGAVLMLLLFVFLMTKISQPIWSSLTIIQYIQFPWRLLGVAAVLIAVLAAYLANSIRSVLGKTVLIFLIIVQASFFSRPVWALQPSIYSLDDAYTTYGNIVSQFLTTPLLEKFDNGVPKLLAIQTAHPGFLVKGVDEAWLDNEFLNNDELKLVGFTLTEAAVYTVPTNRKVVSSGAVSNFKDTPTGASFDYTNQSASRVTYRQLAFPGWQVFVDNSSVSWTPNTNHVSFIVPAGSHSIKITYTNPPGATVGRSISLVTGLLILAYFMLGRRGAATTQHRGRIRG